MKKRETISVPAVGGSSLLVIFAVLCMTMLALLSLSSVQAERRLSEASARSAENYYAADLEAERIFAQIRSGGMPAGVESEADIYRYTCPVSEHQVLAVAVQKTPEGWVILRWQTVAHAEQSDAYLPVWNGQ